jgi:serine O-acetyltransferase
MSSSRVGWRVRVRSYLADAPRGSFVAMLRLVREDYWAHNGDWSRPGLRALAAYRLGHWLLGAPPAARMLLGWYYRRLFVKARNVYGIEIPAEAVIGRRVHFAHQHGTSVHYQSVIGDDCLIRQNVTLGAVSNERIAGGPVLGDRVQLSPGVVIVGRVTIGADARVGPNCVVMTNIPAGATGVASPPRVLRVARRPESAGGRPVTPPPDFVAPVAVAVPAPPPEVGPTPEPLPPDHDAEHALR